MASQNGTADSASDTAVFRLQDLPPEMCRCIFECLVPETLPISSAEPLPTDTLECRKALVNVSYTSKQCRELVLPFLYRHIIITDYVQMAGVLTNLVCYDYPPAWMHSLAVLVEFPPEKYDVGTIVDNILIMGHTNCQFKTEAKRKSESTKSETFKAVGALLDRFEWALPQLAAHECRYWRYFVGDLEYEEYSSTLHEVYEPLLQLLLHVQTNIKDILITVPSDGFIQRLCPAELEDRVIGQFRSDLNKSVSENPFKKLRSIRKQSCPSKDTSVMCEPDPLRPEFLSSREWEFYWDNGSWFFDGYLDEHGWPRPTEPPRDLIVFSHITKLVLDGSSTQPAQLRVILSSCENLKSLTYMTNTTYWGDKFVSPAVMEDEAEVSVPTLQQALDEVKETLTYLCLAWKPWKGGLTGREWAALAPHRVDVSDFPRLTSSEIDPIFVRNDNDALD